VKHLVISIEIVLFRYPIFVGFKSGSVSKMVISIEMNPCYKFK